MPDTDFATLIAMPDTPGYAIADGARRLRTVAYNDSADTMAQIAGKTGLQIMQGIRDGTLPPPPLAELMGFRCILAEPGEVAMRLDYDQSLENLMGMLHGAVGMAMLDTAMGCAAHTMLPLGKAAVTLDISLSYLRALTPNAGPVVAKATIAHLGRTNAHVRGELRDGRDRLAISAVGNFSIVGDGS